MSENKSQHAKCLCGKIELVAAKVADTVGACHCQMCRQWGGGPFMSVDCGSEVSISGDENLTVFESSLWAERGFCKYCGTSLFYRLKDNQQYFVPAALFPDHQVRFDHQVFIDEKPDYYSFSNATKNMTGAELFAAFTESEQS